MRDGVVYVWYLVLFVFVCWACTAGTRVDDARAVEALSSAGYTNIHVDSRDWIAAELRGCSEDDIVIFRATATNPNGQVVHPQVCVGLLKGSTIRF